VEANWAPLLERLYEEHGLPALFLGGPSEAAMVERITSALRTPWQSAVAQTRIKETGALLETAALCCTVDTGPMHMAVAVGCPTVAVFGSTKLRLFDDGSLYVCLHRQFACYPCDRRPICRAFDCMSAVRVEDVARAARGLLGR
jgi:heptosyltransferase-1